MFTPLVDVHTHSLTAKLLVLNTCPRACGAGYQHSDCQGCLTGTREAILDEIESWTKDFNKSPVYWLNGVEHAYGAHQQWRYSNHILIYNIQVLYVLPFIRGRGAVGKYFAGVRTWW